MGSLLLVTASARERRVALVEHGITTEVMFEATAVSRLVGSIYKGRVVRILPGMQSAFVEIGLSRTTFLFAGDVAETPLGAAAAAAAAAAQEDGEPDHPIRPAAVPINHRLTEGQDLIVQVVKEPMGTKGARVSSHISLPGRYLVYLPTVKHLGVSRRIADGGERDRLRAIAESIAPEEGGLIIRTAGEGFPAEAFREDLDFQVALWKDLRARAERTKPPALLHQDLDLTLKATRDLLRPDFEGLLTDSKEEFERLATFIETFLPACRPLLRLESGDQPLFARHRVEHEISRALDHKVWLKSGGTIVIDHTEALTAIDVNTGRYVGKSNFEDTILKINLEAVKEIAYQLRLRNIGGIIVIDFIDMEEVEHRRMVQEALVEALRSDRVRTNVLPMSSLGLVEMTRKRVRESLTQSMSETCDTCEGRGWSISRQEIARQVLTKIRDTLASRRDVEGIEIDAHPRVVETLYDDHREHMEELERRFGIEIQVHAQSAFHVEQYDVRGR